MNAVLALPRQSISKQRIEADKALLDTARRMNKDALVRIFDLYSPALYAYVFRLCNDALMADYIVGDVFAKLLDQFSIGNGPSENLRSYLYEMAYHLIVDNSRSSHREAPLEVVDWLKNDGYSTSISFENKLLFNAIMLAIRNNLTNDQRHVIVLRFLEGFSLRETAAIIEKEVNHVKVIQNRAITTLRRALLDYREVE